MPGINSFAEHGSEDNHMKLGDALIGLDEYVDLYRCWTRSL